MRLKIIQRHSSCQTLEARNVVKPIVDASKLLLEAVERHKIHLSLLVADTGFWVSPEFHKRLLQDTGSAAVFPKVRRARGQGEQRGQIVDGVQLDDNTYANIAIKRAAGLGKSAKGFETCHIWPRTCYDERYHTAIANIVLLPRALAGLSDHDIEIQKALQYRAFELYEWYPEGMPQPVKPEFYPTEWREPLPDPAVNARMPRAVSSSSQSPSGKNPEAILPIELFPDDPAIFKQALLQAKKAEILVMFSDGSIQTKIWDASRISKTSNVIGNLRSRPEFRSGQWKNSGILRIEVHVAP
jgi:hypothetical protein